MKLSDAAVRNAKANGKVQKFLTAAVYTCM